MDIHHCHPKQWDDWVKVFIYKAITAIKWDSLGKNVHLIEQREATKTEKWRSYPSRLFYRCWSG